VTALDDWIERETRFAVGAMLRAVSATNLVKERPGFGQRVVPRSGSVLASPIPAAYDPDPDYFFHWFRDSAIIIDALRVAEAGGGLEKGIAVERLREFVDFSRSMRGLDGREIVRHTRFREKVQSSFLQYVRPDDELTTVFGDVVLAEARVNPDGTLDFTRWARPQNDGPALRVLALTRWGNSQPDLDKTLRAVTLELVVGDLDFIHSRASEHSFDIWEEDSGYHYYTQLVQAQALASGAEWLRKTGDATRAHACRSVADELTVSLDAHWSAAEGYYRSRTGVGSGVPERALDISVILGVLHAGRAEGAHSVLDPRAQATLTALEDLFDAEYVINRERSPERGPALGRYANDAYYGGNPWYLATLAAAEFYFRLAIALQKGAEMPATIENARFRERLGAPDRVRDSRAFVAAAFERGDAFTRTVQAYTPASGDLSEQFDRTTGAQTSAKHLAWSYAAFITAAASRRQAYQAIRG
jgi:glucoamylase